MNDLLTALGGLHMLYDVIVVVVNLNATASAPLPWFNNPKVFRSIQLELWESLLHPLQYADHIMFHIVISCLFRVYLVLVPVICG